MTAALFGASVVFARGYMGRMAPSNAYKNWVRDNPKEYGLFKPYCDAILAGRPAAPPSLSSWLGRAMVWTLSSGRSG